MANKTAKLNLNVWQEHDIVDFNEINANFETIDGCRICYESKNMTAAYSGAVSGSLSWKVQSYTDGSIEMLSKLDCSTIDLSSNKEITFNFPVALSSIYDVHLNINTDSTTLCNAYNVSDPTSLSAQTFLLKREGTSNTNQKVIVFVVVKGNR